MTTVSQLISEQANANMNKSTWGTIIYNVKAYGAIGDGVTDDTTSIQAAQAALATLGGGILFFPKGTYIYNGRLTLTTGNMIIEGVGNGSVLKCKLSTFAPDTLIASANKNNIIIRNMKFEGNGSLPSGSAGTAPSALFFQSGNNIVVDNIEMTGFMGIGVTFSGCTNGKVFNSYFHAMGQNLKGLTPITGVPAVYSGGTSFDIKVIGNRFYDCRFSGIFHFAVGGEISGNAFEHIGESAIYTEYNTANITRNLIISNNQINDCYVVDIAATGIECSSNQSIITGNIISNCEGNGIGVGASSNVVIEGNICFNNNIKPVAGLGGSGILLINIAGAVNPDKGKNIIIKGNVCYDDQSVPTQKYGISVNESGSSTVFLRVVIEGNSCYGNTTADLYIKPSTFADGSNVARNNTPWKEVHRDVALVTQNTVSTQDLKTYIIPAGSMLLNRGIRIKAFGTATGIAGAKTIRLKHNNGVGFATVSFIASDNGQWMIEAEIYNTATNAQIRHRYSYANTGLQEYGVDTAAVDTTINQSLLVQSILANAADSITCSGFIVERI